MDQRVFMRTAIIIMCLMIEGCSLFAGKPVPEYRDPAQTIKTKVGQEFVIVLVSNLTTGYQWQLTEGADGVLLKLLKNEYVADGIGRVGAGGTERWTFKALKSGKTILSFGYVRLWEKDIPPVKREDFKAIIK